MKSPFKFLDSFTKEDREIFFGREKEIEELYRRVFRGKIMLVYGVSGTGKSSLINCGLANKFQDEDWLPVNVRRGNNMLESMYAAIVAASLTPISQYSASETQFRKYVKSLYLDHYKPIYFIFDQFEELFIFGSREEKSLFVRVIKNLVDSDILCRFIFVMREEYMASVTEFEKLIPVFFSNRVRIENMDINNALQAILGPCKVFNINIEEGFPEALIENLSPGSPDIELTYLQVFLDKVYRLSVEESGTGEAEGKNISFTIDQLKKTGNVSDLLGAFLNEQISLLVDPDTALAVLKSFVSIKGTKKQMTLDEVKEYSQTLGKPISNPDLLEMLQNFVHLRILRDKDQHERYELRHDSLATRIYEKISVVEKDILEIRQFIEDGYHNWQKRGVLLNANDLDYIAPYESRLFLSAELQSLINQSRKELEKTRQRRRAIFVAATLALLIVFAGFTVWALIERNKSKKQELFAKSNYLYATSKEYVDKDALVALRLAEASHRYNQSEQNYQNLIDIYTKNEFYNHLYSGLKGDYYRGIKMIGEKGHIALAAEDGVALIDSTGTLLSFWKMEDKYWIFDISPDLKYRMFIGIDDTLRLFDSANKLIFKGVWLGGHGDYPTGGLFYAGFMSDSRKFYVMLSDKILVCTLDGKVINATSKITYGMVVPSDDNQLNIYKDDSIFIWDTENNRFQIKKIYNKTRFNSNNQSFLMPDGAVIYFDNYTEDSKIYFQNNENKITNSWPLKESINFMMPIENKYILTCGQTTKIWDYQGNIIKTFKHKFSRYNIMYDPVTKRIIFKIGNKLCNFNIRHLENETVITFDNSSNIYNVTGNYFIRVRNDTLFDFYDYNGIYKCTFTIPPKQRYWFSESLKLYAFSDFNQDKTFAVVCDSSGVKRCSIDLLNQRVSLLRFSSDDKLIASRGYMQLNYITLWNSDGKKLRTITGTGGSIRDFSFLQDRRYILLIEDYVASLLDTSGNSICHFQQPDYITGFDILKDGSLVAIACYDGTVRLWTKEGKLLFILGTPAENTYTEVKFSPSGSLLITSYNNNVMIFDIKGHLLNTVQSNTYAGYISFSEDEKAILIPEYKSNRIRKVSIKEPVDLFLKSKDLLDLSIEDKLKHDILTFNDVYKKTSPNDLFEAGGFYLNSALTSRDQDIRETLFTNAQLLFEKGAIIDTFPVRFYLKLNDLYISRSSYTGVNNILKINDIFSNIIKSIEYTELKDALQYYYSNTSSSTLQNDYPRYVIMLMEKLLALFPSKAKFIIRNYEGYSFALLKLKENKAALEYCLLQNDIIPDYPGTITWLPLCYLKNDSTDKAKELYSKWKNVLLPPHWISEREPTYGSYFRSDLLTMQNSGNKVKDYDEIMEFLNSDH